MDAPASYVPFCGLPPVPLEIWQRWLLHPVLLGVLAAVPWLILRAARGRWSGRQRGCFVAGWGVVTVALVSPLCALSVALFSMRATQHMALLVVAAPLLALAQPQLLLPRALQAAWRRFNARPVAVLPMLVFAVLLWVWHLPRMYDATFQSDLTYWAMHLTLFAAALPLWVQLLRPGSSALFARVLLGFGTFMQMGLLGALLTLSPALLYSAHVTTSAAWGLTPLADQQLGGMIMWVPGCAAMLVAILLVLYRGMRGETRTTSPAA